MKTNIAWTLPSVWVPFAKLCKPFRVEGTTLTRANLMNHARLIGFLKKEHGNPAKGIPLFKQQSEGWEPWPDDMREEFERIASARARLVYELCIGTGQRIGDILKMRWDHFKDGAYDFT